MNSQKKLKLILASLKDRQIIKFFEVFMANFPDQLKKTIRQISFNCFESVCEFKNKVVSGYGKNSQQSYINSIRTLVELVVDDSKYHDLIRESLRIVQQLTLSSGESQKKLVTVDSMKSIGIAKVERKSTVKEEIFDHMNLDGVKISNPSINHHARGYDKYVSKQEEYVNIEEMMRKNRELEDKIIMAKQENTRLKMQLRQFQENDNSYPDRKENVEQKIYDQKECTATKIYEPLKPRTNEYLNTSHDTKLLEKSNTRSVSVSAGQTQKYAVPRSNDKKIAVPKLNLQVLPNYHGKSNKSLNQSLMEVYEKTHGK